MEPRACPAGSTIRQPAKGGGPRIMTTQALPQHIAIIMDGNGRWATSRGLPRLFGHRAGAKGVRRITEVCCELRIPALTLYAFSWENWNRPAKEIRELMELLGEFLVSETPRLQAHGVRLRAIGRLHELPPNVLARLHQVMDATASSTHLNLTLALSYGGRQEIVDATRRIANEAIHGHLDPAQIDEALFSRYLNLPELPDPDLLIRTSGEQRLSNFLLWQISYCELYVTPKYWPDFTKADLLEAIAAYQQRQRRFGKRVEPTPHASSTNGTEQASGRARAR